MSNATNKIKLHSKNLAIATERIQVSSLEHDGSLGDRMEVLSAGPEEKNDIYAIEIKQLLEANSKYLVMIPFNATLNEGLQGYYRSSYVDKKHKGRR